MSAVSLRDRLIRTALRMVPRDRRDDVWGDLHEEVGLRSDGGGSRSRSAFSSIGSILAIGLRMRLGRLRTGGSLGPEIRISVRRLLRQPGPSAVVVLTLAFGIGVNAAVLSLSESLFLDGIPYPDADRLVYFDNNFSGSSTGGFGVSYPNMEEVRARVDGLERLEYFLDWQDVNLTGVERAERVATTFATPGYLSLLGFEVTLGRSLQDSDNRIEGAAPVALLSYGAWSRVFGEDPDVIGRTIQLNGFPFEIVGVLDRDSSDLRQRYSEQGPSDLFLPLFALETVVGFDLPNRRGARYMNGLARLTPGLSLESFTSDVGAVSEELARLFPDVNEGWSFRVQSLEGLFFDEFRTPMVALAIGALLVLVLVVVNLTTLMLVRGIGRRSELSVRRALGAEGRDLLRQLAVEGLVLGSLGGVIGLALAIGGLQLLGATEALQLPDFVSFELSLRGAAAGLILTVFTGVLLGLVPYLEVGRSSARSAVGSRASVGSSVAGRRLRNLFVGLEMGLAIVLLVGAGLVLSSLRTLQSTEYGFDPDHLLTLQISLPAERYDSPEIQLQSAEALVASLRTIPGVRDAMIWSPNRLGHGNSVELLTREGRWDLHPEERIEASQHRLLPGTFDALGIPLLQGRDFLDSDRAESPRVAIVSRSLAEHFWPEQNPVGRRIESSEAEGMVQYDVVGVVDDVRNRTRLVEPFGPQLDVYFPYLQQPSGRITFLLRGTPAAPMASIVTEARGRVQAMDSELPVFGVTTMQDRMRSEEGRFRLSSAVAVLYALLALFVAAVGVYGVLAQLVLARRSEIGIRKALGARGRAVMWKVAGDGLRVALIGWGVGLGVTWLLARGISGVLYGVDARDPVTFAAASAVLLLVAFAASAWPASTAARLDPARTLREEGGG